MTVGDSRRFDLFAKVAARNFPPESFTKVADVAGGKGYLQLALRQQGYSDVTTFDKRNKRSRLKGTVFRHRFFGSEIKDSFDLILGMHPDEATDVIIVEAIRRRVPFIICPCCIMPTVRPFWGQHKYQNWLSHLKGLAEKADFRVQQTSLQMTGRNIVLIGRPGKL